MIEWGALNVHLEKLKGYKFNTIKVNIQERKSWNIRHD